MGDYYGFFRRKSEGKERDVSSKTGKIQVWENRRKEKCMATCQQVLVA